MIRFKRGEYHGKFRYSEPVWHILDPRLEGHEKTARVLRALCTFEYSNTLMDAKISKAKKAPGKECKQCLKKLVA